MTEMLQPIFSESLPLGRYSDIHLRLNVLSPWQVTMRVSDGRGEIVMVDLNEDDLRKLAIICHMAAEAIRDVDASNR